jgi:quinoprotein glucose dehydrogenase
VPGEQLATTQLLPTLPPPFTRTKFTEDLVTDRTPAARKAMLKEWRSFRSAGE